MVALRQCFTSGSLFRFNPKKTHEMNTSFENPLILFVLTLKSVGSSYMTHQFLIKNILAKYICLGSYNKMNYTVLSLYNLKENT